MLCRSVKRNSSASSSRFMLVAAAATAMLVRLIILPITPPAELAAAISTGFIPSLSGGHHLQECRRAHWRTCRCR